MFSRSVKYYDLIYAARGKDYAREAEIIDGIIRQNCRSSGNKLLDIGCGTGGHLAHLKHTYVATGLDLDAGMVNVARRRHPSVEFVQGDMQDFHLGRRFDAIVSLFSAIGYVQTIDRLNGTLACIAEHLEPGGVVVIEPWLTPEDYVAGTVHAVHVDEPDLKISRMVVSRAEGRLALLEFHYMIATPGGVEHFTEMHQTGLFTRDEYLGAFMAAGLDAVHDPEGLGGRGLYVGVRVEG